MSQVITSGQSHDQGSERLDIERREISGSPEETDVTAGGLRLRLSRRPPRDRDYDNYSDDRIDCFGKGVARSREDY